MCFSPPPPPMAPMAIKPTPIAEPIQTTFEQVQTVNQDVATSRGSSKASGTQQVSYGGQGSGQGGGSTMLTAGAGIDPLSLELGKKSLLGG